MSKSTPIHLATIGAASFAALAASLPSSASSHSDAPLIKQDPQANLTDVYAFIGARYDDPSRHVLNIVANVRPFSEPGDGPHYDRFADDARYSLHVADPRTGRTIVRYDFEFSVVDAIDKNPDTILSFGLGAAAGPIETIGDARQNFVQSYEVRKVVNPGFFDDRFNAGTRIASGLLVAPPNVGANVTPLYNDADGKAVSGAQSLQELDRYTAQAIGESFNRREVFFAGPRDDSFFADIPGTFDLLNVRILDNDGDLQDGLGQDGNGFDGFRGFNVLSFAIQIPVEDLPAREYNDAFFGEQTGVGVYASVSRPRFRSIREDGQRREFGGWVQVNRLGNPLFNEALVPLRDKDRFNRTSPSGDASFATYAQNPELASLINFVYETAFAESGRADLEAVFIPDVLRVATTTGPVRLEADPNFSRLGFIGGDTSGGVSSGWPNGRRFGDDVIDIALTAIASGPSYTTITVVGDNMPGNDIPYNGVFPYAATPHAGTNNSKDRPAPSAAPTGPVRDVNGDGVIDSRDVIEVIEAIGSLTTGAE